MIATPTVKQLKYLCALADTRHFGQAAKNCYVSQSALSTGINELEQNLGLQLFERGAKVLLTEAGERLEAEARQILNQLDHFVTYAEQYQGRSHTDLKIGVIPTIAPFLLPQILKSIRADYQQSKVFIREDLSPNLLELLGKGELDVLLFAMPYDVTGFHAEYLFEDELVLCLPESHSLNKKQSVQLSDLKQQEVLLLEDGHCLRDQSLKACKLNTEDMTIPYQATSLNTLVQMVANNIGITLLPKMAINANLMHETNTSIRTISASKPISRDIALVWRKQSPREQEFKQLAETICQTQQESV